MDLSAFEANYQPTAAVAQKNRAFEPTVAPKPKMGGLYGAAVNFLPTIVGGAGAALGTVAGGPAGTVAGGTLGSGLGEYLRQKLSGEADDGIDKGNIVQESIFGSLPGIGKSVKAVKTARAAAGGIEAAGGLRGVLTGAKLANAVEDVVPLGRFTDKALVMKGVEDIITTAEKTKGIPVKYVDDVARGTGKKEVVAKTFSGAGAADDAATARKTLAKSGYTATQKSSFIPGRQGVPANQKAADSFAKEYADALQQMDSGLSGGNMIPDGSGGYKRMSEHTPFYREVFKNTGRAPTKADWLDEAKRQLANGKADSFAQQEYDTLIKGTMSNTATPSYNVKASRTAIPLDTTESTVETLTPKTPSFTRTNPTGIPGTAKIPQPQTTESALQAMDKAAPANITDRASSRFIGGSNGIKPGAKVGSQTLTAKRSAELNEHITRNIGAKATDAADTILQRNEAYIKNAQQQLDDVLETRNFPTTNKEYRSIVSGIKKPTGVNLADNATHQELLRDAQGITDVKGWESFRREVDDIINFSRNEASPDPATERIALAWRRSIDDYVSKSIPELKDIKRNLNKAYDTKLFIEPAARNAGGFGWGGIKVGGRAMQGAKRATGVGIEKINKAIDPVSKIPGAGMGSSFIARTAKAAVPQAGYRLAGQMLGVPPTNEQPVETTQPQPTVIGSTNPAADMLQQSSNGLPSLEQVQAYLASGGKIDDVAKYVALAEKLGASSGGGSAKGLNSTAAGTLTDLENGLANIRSLTADVQASDANDPIMGRIRSLNPYDTEAQNLQANLARIKQLIGKALEGGVLRKEDEVKYNKILPTIKDTDSTAVYKINQIADDIDRKIRLYKTNLGAGSGGLDVASLVTAQ